MHSWSEVDTSRVLPVDRLSLKRFTSSFRLPSWFASMLDQMQKRVRGNSGRDCRERAKDKGGEGEPGFLAYVIS